MKLKYEEKPKNNKKNILIAIYVVLGLICVLAISIIISQKTLGDKVVDSMFGIDKITNKDEIDEMKLKEGFEDLFNNELKLAENSNINNVKKLEEENDLVYTCYEEKLEEENLNIDVNLPYININNGDAKKFNNEIENVYKAKVQNAIENQDFANVRYLVKYFANVENDILSVVLYTELKQGESAQRLIVEAFNYDVANNKKITFREVLGKYNFEIENVRNKIQQTLITENEKSTQLKEMGYNVFVRDLTNKKYKIDNVKEFFVIGNNIYIVFAYGNEKLTTEKDIIIL